MNTRDFIADWEKLARIGPDGLIYPYLDAAGNPTQGYGHRVDSMDSAPWTAAHALEVLEYDISGVQSHVLIVSRHLAQYPEKLTAIVSFAFNCGASAYENSTLRKCVDKEEWPQAAVELLKWNHADGKVLAGLTKRRQAEAELLSPGSVKA